MKQLEKHLAYIWKSRLFDTQGLLSTTGDRIEIIDYGQENLLSGPDFFNAKIRINDTLWAGNIEIHTLSSDWFLHGHHQDKTYDSVVLHVVDQADRPAVDSSGRLVPQLCLPYSPGLIEEMDYLLQRDRVVACSMQLDEVDPFLLSSWKNRLLSERLEQKTRDLIAPLRDEHLSWDECFYRVISRAFGFGSNAEAFERIARSLPLSIILKHTDSQFQIEALFFGQAGLLDDPHIDEEYPLRLCSEYKFLRHKYGLTPVAPLFNMKVNKGNLPAIRLAQLAQLIGQTPHLPARLAEAPDLKSLKKELCSTPHAFWDTHYSLRQRSDQKLPKAVGNASLDLLIINAVVPLLFALGQSQDNEPMQQRAFSLLETLPPEANSIVRLWQNGPLAPSNAFDTQALIQLHKRYCLPRDCFRCRIAHEILKRKYPTEPPPRGVSNAK